jgi:hypothetical protein
MGVAVLGAAWAAAFLAGSPLGSTVHVLGLAAGALVWMQIRSPRVLNAFELWQGKQRALERVPARRRA